MGDRALALESNRQSEMANEPALKSIAEAVGHYRVLAGSNPAAFLPGLARSVSVLGDRYAELERLGEARNAAAEALELLAPFFAKYPGSFDELAQATVGDYVVRSQELKVEMDEEILLPYLRLFEEGDSDGGRE